MKLKQKDPTAFKLWSLAIRAELKNLVTQGTFAIVNPEKDNKIIPTTLVLKVKLTSGGNWDKAKHGICIRGDIQNMESQEDTWSPTPSKKTFRLFLANAARNNSKIKQLDYVGAFLQAPVQSKIFVSLPSEYLEICPEYAQYYSTSTVQNFCFFTFRIFEDMSRICPVLWTVTQITKILLWDDFLQ